ncbi:MAG: acyl-CoA dehydrogenase family protein [Deltaproteobacteria bacterium]|nr:acyl-CoA dehydrogenase family protein [Deltaproteobacteria bacterium]
MDFKLSDEQQMMRDSARRFAQTRLAPLVTEDEKAHRFRPELVREMGELGMFGAIIDERYGGTGAGWLASAVMTLEIAKVWASYGLPFNMQMHGPAYTIQTFGTEAQKEKYIPGLVAGKLLGGFAMTEPGTGSDVAGMKSTATKVDGGWKLSGQKTWISQAHVADMVLAYVSTDRAKKAKGMTCFLVDLKGNPGITTRPIEEKFGLYCSPTGEIFFEDAFVPDDAVLGQVGDGFKICMTQLESTRLSCAARAVAVGQAALDAAATYAKERKQFDQPIASFQMVQADLVQMYVEHQAAELLLYKAAVSRDEGDLKNGPEISCAKYFAAEAAVHAANTAMKILGSYGFSLEYPVARLLRDAKSFQIVEGTSNVQKIILGRHLLSLYE